MVDTFQVDRKAWEMAKAQLTENAPHSSIALLAEEIKRKLIAEEKAAHDQGNATNHSLSQCGVDCQ